VVDFESDVDIVDIAGVGDVGGIVDFASDGETKESESGGENKVEKVGVQDGQIVGIESKFRSNLVIFAPGCHKLSEAYEMGTTQKETVRKKEKNEQSYVERSHENQLSQRHPYTGV